MICRNCGAGLEEHKMDIALGVVTCSHCGSLHDLPGDSRALPAGAEPKDSMAKPERLEAVMPSKFKLRRNPGGMVVSWPVGGLFHGVVLSIIAAGFAYAGLVSGMLFLLPASAGIAYFAAVRTVNTHHIYVDGSHLKVTQGPLPWPGTRKLDASDIEQLYATEHESRSDAGRDRNRSTRVRKYYRLSASTRVSGRVTILSGLHDPHQALWLEQEIERLLGIDDKRVAGEYVG